MSTTSSSRKPRDILEYKKGTYGDGIQQPVEDNVPYLDLAAVAPSPSRDYFRVCVTKSEVALTQWRITHGPRSVPVELRVPLENFSKDIRIPSEVNRVFGKECVDYIVGLSKGHVDKVMQLSDSILARIFQYAGMEHLKNLAPVCSRFAAICQGDDLWKRFYFQYGGIDAAAVETKHQADYLSWKSLFFINRLHYKVGNPDKFPGFYSDRNLSMNLPPAHRRERSNNNNKSSVSSSSSTQHANRQRSTNPNNRDPSNTRQFIRGRTARIVDGNLVPRASASKLNEISKKGSEGGNSPRQKATRYTLLNNEKSESRKSLFRISKNVT